MFVERLFLAVPWCCLRFVIVVFPDHTHLLFLKLLRHQFRTRCIYTKILYLTFYLGVKVTQNVAQHPLHLVAYSALKFEVATSNGL